VERHDGAVWLHGLAAGPDRKVRFTLPDGSKVTLLLLRQVDAEASWKIESGGWRDLLMTTDQAFVAGDVATLMALGSATLSARLLASDDANLVAVAPAVKLVRDGAEYSATLASAGPANVPVAVKQAKPAGEVAPLPAGFAPSSRPRVVAAAPADADWERAATWSLTLPRQSAADAGTQRFLRIRYVGDVARLSAGGHLLTDDFSTGRPWLVGLARFAPELQKDDLQLAIYPLRKDAPIFFEPGHEPDVQGAQAVSLQSVELLTQSSVKMKLELPAAKKH
jgi:hypothetical protein